MKDCHKPKACNKFFRQGGHANTSACTRSDDSNEHALFLMSSGAFSASQWYIDYGVSLHMTNNKMSIVQFQEFSKPELVRMGNSHGAKAYGKGNIWIKVKLRKFTSQLN